MNVSGIDSTTTKLKYVQVGKLVVFTGFVHTTSALSQTTNIFSGMPIAYSTSNIGIIAVNTSTGTQHVVTINENGIVSLIGNTDVGWIRLNGAYIANSAA